MSRMPDEASRSEMASAPTGMVEDVTCLGCGCLCDDIVVRVEGGSLAEIECTCTLGKAWFSRQGCEPSGPEATVAGQSVALDEALDEAAALLVRARAAVVYGLAGASLEAQAVAVGLADRLGAAIDVVDGDENVAARLAVARVGHVSATLGEVKSRADLVIYWGCDPATTHPRHMERYAVEPRGRFVPGGRADRFVIVVDGERTATAESADLFVPVEPGRWLALLSVLRGMLRAGRLDRAAVESATGVAPALLSALFERLKGCRYGALFHGTAMVRAPGGRACLEALFSLARERNLAGAGRFVVLPLGGPGNGAGASAVMGWQAGAPGALDFARGYPRFLPAEGGARERLARGEADLLLAVSPGDENAAERWEDGSRGKLPRIVIAPDGTDPRYGADVAVATARLGTESGGTVLRCDGVALPLRPMLNTRRPTDRAVLAAIVERVEPLLQARGRFAHE